MKKMFFYITAICVISQFSCKESSNNPKDDQNSVYPALPAFTVQWGDTNSVVCFGTSLTYGNCGNVSQCPGNETYPRFLQDQLKIKVYNQGYNGATIENQGVFLLDDSVLSKKPVLVLLEFGANEFFNGTPADNVDTSMSRLIRRIQSDSVKVVLLSFINPDMANHLIPGMWSHQDSVLAPQYWTMINNVAARYSVPLIDYPFKGIWGQWGTLMAWDFAHPNGAGYSKMATNVYQALIETFRANGMLK